MSIQCIKCGKILGTLDNHGPEGNPLCYNCANEISCEECNTKLLKSDLIVYNSRRICKTCYNKLYELRQRNEQGHYESISAPDFAEGNVLASQNQRLGTYLLDIGFYLLFCFFLGLVIGATGLMNLNKFVNNPFFGFIVLFIYYVPQESFAGRTLGKRIVGTKAVNEDGSELTFNQVLVRTLCRCIPFEAFSFLGGNGRPRGWHDKISKTKVISVSRN